VEVRFNRVLLIADFFVILVLLSSFFNKVKGNGVSLYEETDPMYQLNNETVYKELEGSQKIWVVEFYSSWCGHCQQFAPTWRKLAFQMKNWKRYVNVGAINCAAEKNFDTCVAFGIHMYPTIKIYKPNWKRPLKAEEPTPTLDRIQKRKIETKNEKMGIIYEGTKKVEHIRRSLIDEIEKESKEQIPEKAFDFASVEEIDKISTTPATYYYLFILFESSDSYIGKNLILDTTDSNSVLVKRVDFNNEILAKKFQITKEPSLVAVNLESKQPRILQTAGDTYGNFVDALNTVMKVIEKGPVEKKKDEKDKEVTQKPQLESEVNQMDILSAVGYSLKREVPKKNLDEHDLVALRHWVTMLAKCLPGRKPFKSFLNNLHQDLEGLPDHHALTTEQYSKTLQKAQDDAGFQLIEDKWKSCEGSEIRYRGFPCGLWTVFHTLTVSCADLDSPDISGLNVLIGIRDFISKFFGCVYCRNHFEKMAKTIRKEVQSHDDSILWLWKSHNMVNARLQKDASTDPVHPKIQFPPQSMCKECRSPSDDKQGMLVLEPGYNVEKTSWNKRVVLEFLKEHYSPDNIRVKDKSLAPSLEADPDDDSDNVRRRPNKFTYRSYPRKGSSTSFSFIGLSYFDTSLCVFLYVIVIMVLIVLYIYFLRSRRRSKRYNSYV